ncbi:MAG: transglycosylase SLT domain-containing protein [Methylotenera sp.]
MWQSKATRKFVYFWLCVSVVLMFLTFIGNAFAEPIPRAALKHRAELTRAAHSVWGLNAPIPVFAAQIQQESGWNASAVSHVGALGMAQFMPATSTWWCEINQLSNAQCLPNNPQWAMRALVGYDLWLYQRVKGVNEYDKMHAALRSYNGGLGHWQREAALAVNSNAGRQYNRVAIDSMCGKAKRSYIHCRENLTYPHRILNIYQPRYYGWGRGVFMTGGAA